MSESAPGVGSRLGPYVLKRLLGRGGMGQVFEAEDTQMDRVVALKLMSANYSQDPEFRKRLQREARIAGRLQEPHVVPIHDSGEIDGQLYVDMRLIEGTDLDTQLRKYGPLTTARAVAIVRQIAAALDAAHKLGVLHRDVKPANILVTSNDFAYLVDFGIANAVSEEKLTQLGDVLGTWTYMAPERFSGDNDKVTRSADIYALACVLYECLTGVAPFRGNRAVLMTAHLTKPPPRACQQRPGIPPAFDEVIARGMAKNPADRYESAGDLARAAQHALSTPDRDRADSILQRSGASTPPLDIPTSGQPSSQSGAPPRQYPQYSPIPSGQPPATSSPPAAAAQSFPGSASGASIPGSAPATPAWTPPSVSGGGSWPSQPPGAGTSWPSAAGTSSPPAPGTSWPSAAGTSSPSAAGTSWPSQPPPAATSWPSQAASPATSWPSQSGASPAAGGSWAPQPGASAAAGGGWPAQSGSFSAPPVAPGGTPPVPARGKAGNRRNVWIIGGAAAVVVVLAVVIAVVVFSGGDEHKGLVQAELPISNLNKPGAVAVDSAGNVYVGDVGDHRVVKLAADSNSTTDLPFTGLNVSNALAVDSKGNVYVADSDNGGGNGQVLKLAPGASGPTKLPFKVTEPTGVAVDKDGNVYVADAGGNQILELAPGDNQTPEPLPIRGANDQFTDVAVDKDGNVYVADAGNHRVIEFPSGAGTTKNLPFSGLDVPNGQAVDQNLNVYVSDANNERVLKLAPGASSSTELPFTGLHKPGQVAVDNKGNVYVADVEDNRVLKLPQQ